MLAQLYGILRGSSPSSSQALNSNKRGDLASAPALPPYADIAALGNSWHASIPTGSAFTTVAAWPTTRAELVLSNIAQAGGPSLIIDQVWFTAYVTEAASGSPAILAQMSPSGLVAVAADNTNVLCRNLNGKAGTAIRSANAALAIANTAFAVASQWQVVGVGVLGGAAVTLGHSVIANIEGRYVVQPQATFCMNAVIGTAVASGGLMGVSWHEANVI